MYKLSKTNLGFDPILTIEDNDIYNSKFLYDMDNTQPDSVHKNRLYIGRLDLVADEIYPTHKDANYGVLALYNRYFQEDDTKYDNVNVLNDMTIRMLRLG